MSTRSYISYEMKNGSYSGVYCHHDGYPGCVGATLLKKYNSSNIMKLIDLGNFSSLGNTPEETKTFSYDSEDYVICETREELYKMSNNSGAEYTYVLLRNGDWTVYLHDDQQEVELKEVLSSLQRSYKSC